MLFYCICIYVCACVELITCTIVYDISITHLHLYMRDGNCIQFNILNI